MFDFFDMMDNYEERKIGRYETDDLIVSTAMVTDSDAPYETAVSHPNYNDGKFVIVQNYHSRDDAEAGHEHWVDVMTAIVLPESLRDVGLAHIAQLSDMVDDDWRDFDESDLFD
jgi:hypothetical protein